MKTELQIKRRKGNLKRKLREDTEYGNEFWKVKGRIEELEWMLRKAE